MSQDICRQMLKVLSYCSILVDESPDITDTTQLEFPRMLFQDCTTKEKCIPLLEESIQGVDIHNEFIKIDPQKWHLHS